jgi:hypothetical protein
LGDLDLAFGGLELTTGIESPPTRNPEKHGRRQDRPFHESTSTTRQLGSTASMVTVPRTPLL